MQNFLNMLLKKINKIFCALNRKKLLFGLTAIVIVAILGFYGLAGAQKTEGSYITNTVKKGSVTNTIPATGTIEPVTTISLGFENSELLKKIYVKVGDHVTAGQLLAEQDSTNLSAQLIQNSASLKSAVARLELLKNGATQEEIAQSEASVRIAESNYKLAKSSLERNQVLFQAGAIAQLEFDQANDNYVNAEAKLTQAKESLKALLAGNRAEDIAAAEAQVESSEAQLQMAQKNLAGTKMSSPIDGIVSAVNGAEGQRATANNNNISGGGFITLISETLQVEAQVNEADIGKLVLGQKVEFTVNAFSNKTFTGSVSSISPQAETISNVQIYQAVIRLDENQHGLMAGMPVNANIVVDKQENVLTIPKGAVTYASSYSVKTGQSVSEPPQWSKVGGNSGSAGGLKSGAGAKLGSGSEVETLGSAKENAQNQQVAVVILNKSGNPEPRQVVVGLADQSNYAVLQGLSEGDTVIVGAGGSAGAGTGTSSKSGNSSSSPLMPGGAPRR